MPMHVRSLADVDSHFKTIRRSAAHIRDLLIASKDQPLDLLRRMKFELIGRHPIDDRELNLVEQINQTWTFAVALAATRELFKLHPHVGGFRLAPGAHAALPLDIMSEKEGCIGAEVFAAVNPRNNNKLAKDLAKLELRSETHRYIFFMSPCYPGIVRLENLEPAQSQNRLRIQVWSVDF